MPAGALCLMKAMSFYIAAIIVLASFSFLFWFKDMPSNWIYIG